MKAIASFVLLALFSATASATVTIDMVPVGNPGNAPDTRYVATGVGSVDHVYQIGKYEVTAGQYTEFLNAVAKDDPNELYNLGMDLDVNPNFAGCNIKRLGTAGSYSYTVAADWANRPVNFVNFWDAARFANWLDNGQPTGPQGPGTTEGGAYTLTAIGIAMNTVTRRPGAKFFIPTENEWYKAAYHDKNAGLAASYFNYPMGTNSVPGKDITETTNPGHNANFYLGGYSIGRPYFLTEVGEFELSDSPYGTFDQGGNVYEWNETMLYSPYRGSLGGSFYADPDALLASRRDGVQPTDARGGLGFRVASIPEPSSLLLAALAAAGLFWRRRSAT